MESIAIMPCEDAIPWVFRMKLNQLSKLRTFSSNAWILTNSFCLFHRLQHDPLHPTPDSRDIQVLLLSSWPTKPEPRVFTTGKELHLDRSGRVGAETEERVEHDLYHWCGLQSHRCVGGTWVERVPMRVRVSVCLVEGSLQQLRIRLEMLLHSP